jgi:SAM-dependent methyltransferase
MKHLLLSLGLLCLGAGSARAQTTAPPAAAPRPNACPPAPANTTPAQAHENERQRWNNLLTDSTWRATRFNTQPNTLLVETVMGRKPGTALDVGMGEGRNGIYLARQGWQVTGIDIADKALALAQKQAQTAGVQLNTVVADAETYDWGTAKWDLIVLSYAGGREYADQVKKALRPGGLVVLEGFHSDAAKGRKIGNGVVFETDELKKLYAAAGLTIVRYQEPMGVADFSKENLRLVQLVAQKPRK